VQPAVRHPQAAPPLPGGQLKLDELITRQYQLDEINQDYQDLADGKIIRGVINHPS
jgi:Zn-dependent alcohol dehydrogenase